MVILFEMYISNRYSIDIFVVKISKCYDSNFFFNSSYMLARRLNRTNVRKEVEWLGSLLKRNSSSTSIIDATTELCSTAIEALFLHTNMIIWKN